MYEALSPHITLITFYKKTQYRKKSSILPQRGGGGDGWIDG